jgi:hypothetical protein
VQGVYVLDESSGLYRSVNDTIDLATFRDTVDETLRSAQPLPADPG